MTALAPVDGEAQLDELRLQYLGLEDGRLVVAGSFRGTLRFGEHTISTPPGEETDLFVGIVDFENVPGNLSTK